MGKDFRGFAKLCRRGVRRVWQWIVHLPNHGRDGGIFLIFLLIAATLWFFNKLSHEYTVDVETTLALESSPPGRLLVGEATRPLILRLHGSGYQLMRFMYFSGTAPLKLDLRDTWRNFSYQSEGESFITGRQLEPLLSRQMPSGLLLESVLTDSLSCTYSSLAHRKVPVRSHLSYTLADQRLQTAPVRIFPDSVWVSGPEATLDALRTVDTEELIFGELEESAFDRVPLVQLPDVEYSPEHVEVTVPVAQYTECELSIPIQMRGVPDSLEMTLLPAQVTLRFNAPLERYGELQASAFSVYVHWEPLSPKPSLRVVLADVPVGAYAVDFEPKNVQYFIQKR